MRKLCQLLLFGLWLQIAVCDLIPLIPSLIQSKPLSLSIGVNTFVTEAKDFQNSQVSDTSCKLYIELISTTGKISSVEYSFDQQNYASMVENSPQTTPNYQNTITQRFVYTSSESFDCKSKPSFFLNLLSSDDSAQIYYYNGRFIGSSEESSFSKTYFSINYLAMPELFFVAWVVGLIFSIPIAIILGTLLHFTETEDANTEEKQEFSWKNFLMVSAFGALGSFFTIAFALFVVIQRKLQHNTRKYVHLLPLAIGSIIGCFVSVLVLFHILMFFTFIPHNRNGYCCSIHPLPTIDQQDASLVIYPNQFYTYYYNPEKRTCFQNNVLLTWNSTQLEEQVQHSAIRNCQYGMTMQNGNYGNAFFTALVASLLVIPIATTLGFLLSTIYNEVRWKWGPYKEWIGKRSQYESVT